MYVMVQHTRYRKFGGSWVFVWAGKRNAYYSRDSYTDMREDAEPTIWTKAGVFVWADRFCGNRNTDVHEDTKGMISKIWRKADF
jgi:hypothetical protein